MPITLESFVRFGCFNFCLKALDSYIHPILTAGASDPYRRQNSAAAGSYRQPWILHGMKVPACRTSRWSMRYKTSKTTFTLTI